ncbi:hypothetical protein RRG08_017980 [Elysia crispata]|uniref:protein-tyrosine-phosphatase n=1 Tax=Elysia crispata TaxID=231223 RepID=A0AAE0ZDV5_9GAST|nr:hypothetical protein RRG08_017980 [Elysia crispata]
MSGIDLEKEVAIFLRGVSLISTSATVQLGASIGAIVVAFTIFAIIVDFCLKGCRKSKAQRKKDLEDGISLCEKPPSMYGQNRQEHSETDQDSSSNPKCDIEEDRQEDEPNDILTDSAVPVESLKTYIGRHATDSHLEDEFWSIPLENNSPQTAGRSSQNAKKNRYKNIIPYDSTRVLLQKNQTKQSDYFNASYVKGYSTDELYIASQAPSDGTLDDFVRMIWEQRIDRVVMLTNLMEEGKKKCSMYWPLDGEEEFEEVTVRLLTTHVFAEYTIRHLRLFKSGETPRDLIQFHFTAWPDKSVPESPWGLVDLYHRVMSAPGSGPVLVHCSAGVGRSGTYIGLCNLLQEAKATGKMNFRSTLWKLRQARMHTIQTVEQYVFLHKMALVGHMTSGTTIKVKDMYQRLATLECDQEGATPSSSYRQEFEALVEACDASSIPYRGMVTRPTESVYENISISMARRCKNRLSNILPNERFRAMLTAQTHHEDTYINAVFVPNLTKDHQNILTQLPLPSTVTDFWRLVTQFKVGLVVAFELESMDSDDTIGEFLPRSETEPFENDRYLVEIRQTMESSLVSEFTVAVHQKAVKIINRQHQHTLTLLMCKSTQLEPERVLELHRKIKSWKLSWKSRILYMCRNGADHCGLMCVQTILLDRLEADQCLTVPLVVGSIRAIRPQVIPTLDQYKCLYRVLKLAEESQNVQSKVELTVQDAHERAKSFISLWKQPLID